MIVILELPGQLMSILFHSHVLRKYSADRQTCVLQRAVLDDAPKLLQFLPPCFGDGLVQDL